MKPTQKDILAAVAEWGNHNATYVVKNVLRRQFPDVQTPWVLRRLKALEVAGLVERKPTAYAVMIVWGLTPAGRNALKEAE